MANEGITLEIFPYDNPKAASPKWIIPGRKEPKFLEQIKANGGGSLIVPKLDKKLVADPTMLDSRNLVKVKIDNVYVGCFLMGTTEGTLLSGGERTEQAYTVAGEGLKSWFDDAEVYAANGLQAESGKGRFFNFSSPERGDWYDSAKWVDPYYYGTIRQPGHAWSGEFPEKFKPETSSTSKWFGAYPYADTMPYDPYYIRWEFGVSSSGLYAFYVAADDQFVLYVDGEEVAKSDIKTTAWTEGHRVEFSLAQGAHTIGLVVQNRNAPGYFGPTSAIFTLTRVGFDGAEDYIGSSNGADGVLKVMPGPVDVPGWSVGEMLLKLLKEAGDRGVRFPSYLTPTFTSKLDSYGKPWTEKHEWSFSIGESYASVLKTIEAMYDVWITPDFKLNMAPTRGMDRTQETRDGNQNVIASPIKFELGKHILAAGDSTKGKIKNALVLSTTDGWAEQINSASVAKYGRLEGSMQTKTNKELSQKLADIIFAQRAQEEEGATYELVLGAGNKYTPWVSFGIGDWVLAPNRRNEYVPRRIMSISFEELVNGRPKYSIEFDTIFSDNEDRVNAVIDKLGGSGVGGSSGGSALGITPGGSPGTTLPSSGGPVTPTPSQVTQLTVTSEGYWPPDGITPRSAINLEWLPVTQATNGQPLIPARYEVEGNDTSTPEEGWLPLGMYTASDITLKNWVPQVEWEYRVRAISEDEKQGPWSATVEHTGAIPTAPMLAPSKPSVTSSRGVVAVRWDGTMADGSAAPPQFRYCFAEVKAVSSSVWSALGTAIQRGGGQTFLTGLTVSSEYDVRIAAVDGVRIVSPYSESARITVKGVDLGSLEKDVTDAIDAANNAAQAAQDNALTARDIAEAANELSGTALGRADDALLQVSKTVVRVLDEYTVTNSASEPPAPTAVWSPDTPDWGPGEYVWRRSKNTFVDGTYAYNSPVVITGIDGTPGDDAVLLRIFSDRGTSFKNNVGSTTLLVTVYKGTQEIKNITDLRTVFGTGSFLEWHERQLSDTSFKVIPSNDNRLRNSGFGLVVSPSDVNQQTVFECRLQT